MTTEYHVNGADGPENFKSIAEYIVKHGGTVLRKTDGAGAKAWEIKIEGKQITLRLEPMVGIYFVGDDSICESLASELSNRLGAPVKKFRE